MIHNIGQSYNRTMFFIEMNTDQQQFVIRNDLPNDVTTIREGLKKHPYLQMNGTIGVKL